MWVGLLFKLIPDFIKEYVPKVFIVPVILISISSYFMFNYVNAKDSGLDHKIEMQQESLEARAKSQKIAIEAQKVAIQDEIANNYKFTAQKLQAIVNGINEMKLAVQKVNDKVWELSRDVNAK